MQTHTFRTELTLSKVANPFTYSDTFFSIGSCFAENMGQRLAYFKFQQLVNPFGIIFNPYSIAEIFEMILQNKPFNEQHIISSNAFYSLDFHSKIFAQDKLEFIQHCDEIKTNSQNRLKNASVAIITLGTAWVYRYLKTNQYVANCQKISASNFSKELLSIDTIIQSLQKIITLLKTHTAVKHIIFTISPVRHIKDGIVENNLSKAHLISAIHQVLKENVHYFPAYEIVLDDLRDYRFYNADMLHPNDIAIEYIWEKFITQWLDETTIKQMKKVDEIQKGLQHKPFHPQSAEHLQFLASLQKRMELLQQEIPFIQFS